MLTAALALLGLTLLGIALLHAWIDRGPLAPAVVYLLAGFGAMAAFGGLPDGLGNVDPHVWTVTTEVAVLISLVAVGLRIRLPSLVPAWRQALWLSGPGMVVTVALCAVAGVLLLGLPWPAALLLGAILAPTDPVLASELRVTSDHDRDAVRGTLTAEGGLNDATALPAVMLGLGLLGVHSLGTWGLSWAWYDLVWPIGGGAAIGAALGLAIGQALRWRVARQDRIDRDELLYFGLVMLAYAAARVSSSSAFIVAFVAAVVVLSPLQLRPNDRAARELADRLLAFGGRIERLLEAAAVLALGALLHQVDISWKLLAFAAALLLLVRPLSVLSCIRLGPSTTAAQRRLMAWFGIRGVGTLFYLAFALEHGLPEDLADALADAALLTVAVSIVLHGLSATPLMDTYRRSVERRREAQRKRAAGLEGRRAAEVGEDR